MPLNIYKKAPSRRTTTTTTGSRHNYKSNIVLELQNDRMTVGKVLAGIRNDIRDLLTTSRIAGTVIPLIFVLYGLNLLYSQIYPSLVDWIRTQKGWKDNEIVTLVPENTVQAKQQYLSAPGSAYFAQIQNNAQQARVLEFDPTSTNYKGTFQLSIPSLGLKNLPVQANVNSGVEEVYDRILENGLAHMQATGLPISDVRNNIVVYGHSAAGNYFEKSNDPAAAFSVLNKIKLGEDVEVLIDGKYFKYKVYKTKVVNPDDLSIISGERMGNKQTLTLFTCDPPGNNAKRFVVTAVPVE